MNYALIFAGGYGTRMNAKAKPKQFLELNGKAIIIHTIEFFEDHPDIDAIVVVCIDQWIEYLQQLLKRHGITKVNWVVPGGATGQQSIYNGLKVLAAHCESPKTSVVLIHDGVRPLITPQLISANIVSVYQFGSAVTITPATETVVQTNDAGQIAGITDRAAAHMARAPQSFYLQDVVDAHLKAISENNLNMTDSTCLMQHYGYTLHTVEGPVENIKITTPLDYYLFRAIYEARENSQIFGL
jgi:2-C-methyl-D-erythritol 4-phosphate cytidylyltransferase